MPSGFYYVFPSSSVLMTSRALQTLPEHSHTNLHLHVRSAAFLFLFPRAQRTPKRRFKYCQHPLFLSLLHGSALTPHIADERLLWRPITPLKLLCIWSLHTSRSTALHSHSAIHELCRNGPHIHLLLTTLLHCFSFLYTTGITQLARYVEGSNTVLLKLIRTMFWICI